MLAPSLVQARQPAPRDTLRLDAAVQRALDDNRQARIARRETDIAENNVSLGNAGFLPTLSGQANYSKTRSNSEQVFLSGETQSTDGATSTQSGAGADLRWTVFDGLRPFATYDRLGAERDRQAAATDEQVETLVADVIEGYYDVARQQQQLEVLREAVAISRERLRIAELRRELGSASDLEVRQARVDLNADSTEALRAAQAEQRELRADFFPTVDLTAGLNYSQLNAESGFVQENTSTEVTYGVSLTLDLFDGLNRWRRTQNADIRTTNARLAVEDVRSRLVTELTNAYERYRNRLRLVDLERQTLKAVRANVDVALEQFEQGTITSVELREVQEQFVQAESRLLTVQFEAKQAEVELLRLSGQLLDRY